MSEYQLPRGYATNEWLHGRISTRLLFWQGPGFRLKFWLYRKVYRLRLRLMTNEQREFFRYRVRQDDLAWEREMELTIARLRRSA